MVLVLAIHSGVSTSESGERMREGLTTSEPKVVRPMRVPVKSAW